MGGGIIDKTITRQYFVMKIKVRFSDIGIHCVDWPTSYFIIFVIAKRLQRGNAFSLFYLNSFFSVLQSQCVLCFIFPGGLSGYLFSLVITKAVRFLPWQGEGMGRRFKTYILMF